MSRERLGQRLVPNAPMPPKSNTSGAKMPPTPPASRATLAREVERLTEEVADWKLGAEVEAAEGDAARADLARIRAGIEALAGDEHAQRYAPEWLIAALRALLAPSTEARS